MPKPQWWLHASTGAKLALSLIAILGTVWTVNQFAFNTNALAQAATKKNGEQDKAIATLSTSIKENEENRVLQDHNFELKLNNLDFRLSVLEDAVTVGNEINIENQELMKRLDAYIRNNE